VGSSRQECSQRSYLRLLHLDTGRGGTELRRCRCPHDMRLLRQLAHVHSRIRRSCSVIQTSRLPTVVSASHPAAEWILEDGSQYIRPLDRGPRCLSHRCHCLGVAEGAHRGRWDGVVPTGACQGTQCAYEEHFRLCRNPAPSRKRARPSATGQLLAAAQTRSQGSGVQVP